MAFVLLAGFRKFHKSTNITKPGDANVNWPFGETIKVTFNPRSMGDLLSNMYISISQGVTDKCVS